MSLIPSVYRCWFGIFTAISLFVVSRNEFFVCLLQSCADIICCCVASEGVANKKLPLCRCLGRSIRIEDYSTKVDTKSGASLERSLARPTALRVFRGSHPHILRVLLVNQLNGLICSEFVRGCFFCGADFVPMARQSLLETIPNFFIRQVRIVVATKLLAFH